MGTVAATNVKTEEITLEKVQAEQKPVYGAFKRMFDIVVSLIVLVVLFLPMCVVAVIIKIDSKGPVIFKQDRVGKNGKEFAMYKFRTMYVDAEKDGPKWADEKDSRCTRVGRKLRLCRIDELPQFVNVLKGDMSIVGPRPEREYFYNIFEEYIHGFSQRTSVTPGITGWAQINGGYGLLPEEKILYDLDYIKNRSLSFDLLCMYKTVKVVFTHEGAQ